MNEKAGTQIEWLRNKARKRKLSMAAPVKKVAYE